MSGVNTAVAGAAFEVAAKGSAGKRIVEFLKPVLVNATEKDVHTYGRELNKEKDTNDNGKRAIDFLIGVIENKPEHVSALKDKIDDLLNQSATLTEISAVRNDIIESGHAFLKAQRYLASAITNGVKYRQEEILNALDAKLTDGFPPTRDVTPGDLNRLSLGKQEARREAISFT